MYLLWKMTPDVLKPALLAAGVLVFWLTWKTTGPAEEDSDQ